MDADATLDAPWHWLCPAPHAHATTGGDRYNQRMVAALREAGATVHVHERVDALPQEPARVLVDSLFYDQARAIRARVRHLSWLVHWLPSAVRLGRAPEPREISEAEGSAFALGDSFVVPGPFVRECLLTLGVAADAICEVEPGTDAPGSLTAGPRKVVAAGAARLPLVELLCVGNLLPAKGQLELVRALLAAAPGPALGGALDWRLHLVGAAHGDTEYATEVQAAAAGDARVRLHGRVEGSELERLYARCHVLVSMSAMESYGLAIAEARARGLALVLRPGGEAARHLAPGAGWLVQGASDLGSALAQWSRDPGPLHAALNHAHRQRRHRAWSDAAADLLRARPQAD